MVTKSILSRIVLLLFVLCTLVGANTWISYSSMTTAQRERDLYKKEVEALTKSIKVDESRLQNLETGKNAIISLAKEIGKMK